MSPRYTTDPAFRYRLTWTHSHEWPQDVPAERVEPRTFGDLLALLAGGLVAGVVGWIFVVGLFAVEGAG